MDIAPGFITAYYGPMFASKTTKLLEQALHAHACGIRFQAFRPSCDANRYARLQDHAGSYAIDALKVPNARAILGYATDADLLLIDEASLFDDGLIGVLADLRHQGKSAVLTLVDRLTTGEWFPLARNEVSKTHTSKDIIELADYSELVQGKCSFPLDAACERPSRFTCTIEPQASKVSVGKDNYFSCCGHHYALWRNAGLRENQKARLHAQARSAAAASRICDPWIIPQDPSKPIYREERPPTYSPPPQSIGIRTEA